jgi:hypothetical protein
MIDTVRNINVIYHTITASNYCKRYGFQKSVFQLRSRGRIISVQPEPQQDQALAAPAPILIFHIQQTYTVKL